MTLNLIFPLYCALYFQMYMSVIFLFVIVLYYNLNKQLIRQNNLILHKTKFQEALNEVKDKRKWIYDLNFN